MICIYILKKNDNILEVSDIIYQSNFMPSQSIELNYELSEKECLIMPATYMSKIEGRFIISVKAEDSFEFKRFN